MPFQLDPPRPGTTPWVPLLTLVGAGAQTALWLQERWEGLNIAIFSKEGKRWTRVHYGGMAPPFAFQPPPSFTTHPNTTLGPG